jgi:alpha-glucosidase
VLELPHHDGSALLVDEREPALGDTVRVTVRVPHAYPVRAVHVRAVRDGEPAWTEAALTGGDAHDGEWRADLHVANPVTPYRFLLDLGPRRYAWLNGTGVHEREVSDAFDFRLTAHGASPGWIADAVIYQVFCDRFARSERAPRDVPAWAVPADWSDPVVERGPHTPLQFFGGDLWGVAKRLDHVKDLGADVVYLTPFFPAASNHRYNASSFDRVDPLLGGEEALAHLVAEAHRMGLRVIGDLTLNHSGDTHEWFQRACEDPDADEAGYYAFRRHPDDYECWLGEPSLPKFDFSSPRLRQRLVEGPDSVVGRWLRGPGGLDGWRIDVANMMARLGAFDRNHDVARIVRATARAANPEAYLLGEHFHDASVDLAAGGWDGVMNYAGFLRPVWSWLNAGGAGHPFLGMPVDVPSVGGAAAVATMREALAVAPWQAVARSATLLGSHDTPRVRTVLGSDERVAAAIGLLATYPGVPLVFAGDEFALEGIDGEDARKPMPWGDRRSERHPTRAVYRELLGLRRRNPALRRGGLRWAHASDDAMAFLREDADQRLLVLVTRAAASVPLPSTIVRDGVEVLYGQADARLEGKALWLAASGPGCAVWRL